MQHLALGDEDRRDEDEAEERHVGRDEEHEALLDVVDDAPALGQPEHQGRERVVAEHEVGGLAGDRGAAAHRHGDVGAMEGRCVVHAVARSRRRSGGSRERRRRVARFCSGVERATTCRSASSSASRASSHAASSSPVTTWSASRPASRAIVAAVRGWSPVTTTTWMPACASRRHRLAMPGRIGSAKPTRARISHGPSSIRPASADEPLAGRCRRLDQCRPPLALAHRATDRRRRTRGRPRAPRAPGSRCARRVGPCVRVDGQRVRSAGCASTRSPASSSVSTARPRTTASRSARVNDAGVTPFARPGVLLRPKRLLEERRTRGLGPRPARPSVRTDDTSSRFWVIVPVLSVTIRSTAPSVSSALSRRTRTPRLSSRYAPRPRMTASRTGGSSGMAAMAAEMPGQDVLAERMPAQRSRCPW